jgi:hypothetical protein
MDDATFECLARALGDERQRREEFEPDDPQ